MAKESLNKISSIKVDSHFTETISSYELDIIAALVLNDTNAQMTIHSNIEGLSPEPFNIKDYIARQTKYLNGNNILDVVDINDVSVSGTINVTNAKSEVVDALHIQYPNLKINITNDGTLIWFRDPIIYEAMRYWLHKDFFVLSDFNKATNISLSRTNIEYFNEYQIFGQVTISSFVSCEKLKEITLPSRIKTTPVFQYCYELEKINLDIFTTISANAFESCYALKPTDLSENLTSIGNYAFYKCYQYDISHLPSSLKTIGNRAFQESNVSFTEIPSSITAIGSYVFYLCPNLTKIVFNASVSEIQEYCFRDTVNLLDVEINGSVTTIGYGAFYNSKIKKLKITAPVVRISATAFYNCPIEELDIDVNNLTYIGSSAFSNSIDLFTQKMIKVDGNGKKYSDWRNLIYLANSNTYNGTATDYVCDYLLVKNGYFYNAATALNRNGYCFKKIMYDGTLEEFLIFYGSDESNVQQTPLAYIKGDSTFEGFFTNENGVWTKFEGELRIPEVITDFKSNYAFYYMINITSVIAPQLTRLNGTFYQCNHIIKFNSRISNVAYFPYATTMSENYLSGSYINIFCPNIRTAQYAFCGNTARTLDLGNKLETLTYQCSNANTIMVIRTDVPPSLPTQFSTTPKKIYVKPGTLSAYAAATNWWRYTDRTYEIGGTEWVAEFGSANEWADYPDGIEPFSNPNLINSWDDVD